MIGTPPKISPEKGRAPKKPAPTPKKKKAGGLNIRERNFVKGLIKGLTPTEAMRQAGYAETTAMHKQSEKLAKVGDVLQAELEKVGLDETYLAHKLKEGCEATKQISCNVIINGHLSANEQDAMKPAHEMTKDFVEVEDFAVRHKYVETSLKLKGYLQKQDLTLSNNDGSPLQITIELVQVTTNAAH